MTSPAPQLCKLFRNEPQQLDQLLNGADLSPGGKPFLVYCLSNVHCSSTAVLRQNLTIHPERLVNTHQI